MDPDFFKKIQQALASERLEAYGPPSDPQLVLARYLWNIAVCEAFYSPMQMAEVGLRNAVDRVLSGKYGPDWYDQAPLSVWQQVNVTEAKKDLRDQSKPLNPGRIIAEMNFGFWTAFFNKSHEASGLAHTISKQAFPRASKYDRNTRLMDTRWTHIRELRNRVFHHERIIHWNDLKQQHQGILEVIRWMSPELADMEAKLDRFTPVYAAGLQPWRDKVTMFWPNQGKEFNQP